MMFLYTPLQPWSAPRTATGGYYQYLSGSALSEQPRSADELPPDRCALSVPAITQIPFAEQIEAETLSLQKPMKILDTRPGFSGTGYIGKLPENTVSAVTVPLKIKATQHYDITLCAAADQDTVNAISIENNMISRFSLEGSGNFTKITFYGIFLEEGQRTLTLDGIDGGLDIDYILITDDKTEYRPEFAVAEHPCNPNADAETEKLYQFLRGQWGKTILTGQYASNSRNPELNLIYQITGQLPAIRFGMLGTGHDREQINAAIDWSVYMHGIVGLMWEWNAPGTDSVYAEDADFSFHAALRRIKPEKLAAMTPEELQESVESGAVAKEVQMLLNDIDETAGSLQKLANMRIPVLWRPLHEASGEWYWWGASGRDAYQKLWVLLYHRLTDYHKLNNLIWIWNGQSGSYLVPEDTYEIASADVYLDERMEFGSRYEQFVSLAQITGARKMLALSECSALPDPEMMQVDASVWSFFGLWYGDYLMKPDGTLNDAVYTSNDLYNLYNSELALSLNDFLSLYQ